MKAITAKELKNRTGEALNEVARGNKLLITRRGKPVAVMSSVREEEIEVKEKTRPYPESWQAIENTLDETKPHFENWREAVSWSRRRS